MEPFVSRDEMIALLSDLVRIYSPYFREKDAVEYTYAWLKENDLPAELHHFSEDKITRFHGANVVGRLSGDGNGPTVLLNGHLDTVEICEGWTKDPLGAELIGDRMYGVGALDMKAGCAAMLLALRAFAKSAKRFCGSVVYALVSDEEGPYGLGTDALIRDGLTDGVDVAIVLEPSSAFTDNAFPTLCLGARGKGLLQPELSGAYCSVADPRSFGRSLGNLTAFRDRMLVGSYHLLRWLLSPLKPTMLSKSKWSSSF